MSIDTPGNPASRELGYCPCCGYLTLTAAEPGSYEVCPVCHWTDDPVQFSDAASESESNPNTLEKARKNFERLGAVTPSAVEETRDPAPSEQRDPNWPY